RAGKCRFAAEGSEVRKLEQRTDVEVRKLKPGLGLVIAIQRRLSMHGEFGGVQPRGHVVCESAVGGVRNQIQTADRLTAEGQIAESGIGFPTAGRRTSPIRVQRTPACRR